MQWVQVSGDDFYILVICDPRMSTSYFAALQDRFTQVLHKTFATGLRFRWHNDNSNNRPFLSHSRIRQSV